jgi:hypothetical protein
VNRTQFVADIVAKAVAIENNRTVRAPQICRSSYEQAEIEQLLAQIEARDHRIEQLEELVTGLNRAHLDRVPVPGLTRQQTAIVGAIARRGRIAAEDLLIVASERGHELDITTVRNAISRARQVLSDAGIEILSVYSFGYSMGPRARLLWAELVDASRSAAVQDQPRHLPRLPASGLLPEAAI